VVAIAEGIVGVVEAYSGNIRRRTDNTNYNENNKRAKIECHRCGNIGHYKSECYAIYYRDGAPIENDTNSRTPRTTNPFIPTNTNNNKDKKCFRCVIHHPHPPKTIKTNKKHNNNANDIPLSITGVVRKLFDLFFAATN
jgi:hypothetical protein